MATFRYYVATSADGFIADKDGGVGWLHPYFVPDLGFDAFLASVNYVILGRSTYEQARSFGDWPYPGKRGYILTSRPLAGETPPGVEAVDSAVQVVERLKDRRGLAWIVGGASTAAAFLEIGALNEIELYVVPTLLGDGVRLFHGTHDIKSLTLTESEAYRNGIVRLFYEL